MAERLSQMIAVVEDADSVRKALVQLLRVAGYAARGFASGEEFLQAWPANRVSCLILDLELPGLSGIDVQRELHRAQARIPVIIMTADDSHTVREECACLGAFAFLTKPSEISVLLDAVALALDQ